MISKDLRRFGIRGREPKRTFKKGVPTVQELTEMIPVYRETSEGLVEYIRYKNVLYKKVYILAHEQEGGITIG